MSAYTRATLLSAMAALHFAGYMVLAVVCVLIDKEKYKLPSPIKEYLWRVAVVFLLAAIYHAL